MWIVFIAIAVVLSTGTGIYLSRDTNVSIDDRARLQAPQVQAVQANQVARYLRRMFLDDPTMFPAVPTSGEVLIPDALVGMAVTQGTQLPSGVSFVLRSDGQVVPLFIRGSDGDDLRDDMIADTFDRVVEIDGVAPHLYGRRSGPIERGQPTMVREGDGTVTIIDDVDPDGADVGGDGTITNPGGNTGEQGVGDVVPDPDAGTGGTDTGGTDGGTDTGGTDGGTDTGGTGGTGGSTPDADEESTNSDLTIEDLTAGGGRGGSDAINPESYRVDDNGIVYVTEGYEEFLGPRAPFFSSEQLEETITEIEAEKAAGTYNSETYIRPLFFDAFNSASQSRAESEELFGIVCSGVLNTLSSDFSVNLEQMIVEIQEFSEFYQDEECDPRDPDDEYNACLATYDPTSVNEDVSTAGAALATAGGYCMSVMTARVAEFPVRANRGNFTNEEALHEGGRYVAGYRERAWYLADNDPLIESRQPSSLIALKRLLTQVETLRNVELTYPVTENPTSPPAEPTTTGPTSP